MSRGSAAIGTLLLGATLACAAPAAEPRTDVSGSWSLNNWHFGDTVGLKLSYREPGSRWLWGTDQDLADLKGLTTDQLRGVSKPVKFTLERDAGAFFFEGSMMLGIGRGTFRFVPSASYADKLEALGYTGIENDARSLMFMAVRDISLDYAAEVKRLGLNGVELSDLGGFLDHGINLSYIRDLTGTGYSPLKADDVVRLHDHGIGSTLIKGLVDAGRGSVSVDDIIRLSEHGIDARYVARIQEAGFKDVTVDQIVQLHDHGVD